MKLAKRVAALATATVMAFGALVAFQPVEVKANPQVFYNLAEDEMIQEQEVGYSMGENIYPAEWMQAGGGFEHIIVQAPRGHNGFSQINRPEAWNGVDFMSEEVPGVNFATGDYVIWLVGRAGADMDELAIQGADNPWPHIAPITNIGADGLFEVLVHSSMDAITSHESFVEANPAAGEFSPLAFQRRIRINPVGSHDDFAIYEFVVAELGWTPDMLAAAAPAPEATPAAPGGTVEVPAGYSAALRFTVGSTTFANNTEAGLEMDAPPFNQDGRVMVPLRQIGEAFGAELDFRDNTAFVTTGDVALELVIGEEVAPGMGTAVIVDGRTFVPLGFIAQEIGATPRWDGDTNSAYIYIP